MRFTTIQIEAHRAQDGTLASFVPPAADSDPLVLIAYRLACRAHTGQFRRGGAPYMAHVDAVMARAPKDPVSQAVASLHDTLEADCAHQLTYREIAETCGEEVADGVDTLTKRPGETYEAFVGRVATHRGGKWAECKVADILANLSEMPSPKQCRKYGAALLTLVPADPSQFGTLTVRGDGGFASAQCFVGGQLRLP